ncbi:phosphatase PAP2 family protein [Caldovatus aquaticus]|uniref:Phosphatase PAP2 family protein n=1 Tax=Caldovatus aquaticus TaxID=2865671 RepID=A0ABS7F4J4_9PROT|nr:phosphatase PAP2 family protein [Caldovatus aquaticus]MBW8270223.1 phosphatase PAP2 family protein [Caldovatus aquaticus]
MVRIAMDTRGVAPQHQADPAERRAGLLGAFGAVCVVALALYVMLFDRAELDALLQDALDRAAAWADPFRTYWVEQAARDLAPAGGPTMIGLVVAVATAHVLLSRGGRVAALVLTALATGIVAALILKLTLGRSGASFSVHAFGLFSAGFPSIGALLAPILYLTLGAALAVVYGGRLVGAFLIACAALGTLLVGLSRVLLHMHLPTDVLAGWSAGLAWASLCWVVVRRSRFWGREDAG